MTACHVCRAPIVSGGWVCDAGVRLQDGTIVTRDRRYCSGVCMAADLAEPTTTQEMMT